MREDLISLLVRLIMDGLFTEEEAGELLDLFDMTGELPEGWQLPLDPDQAIPDDLQARLGEALTAFAGEPFSELSAGAPDDAQDRFITRVVDLADSLKDHMISLTDWHKRMVQAIIDYLAEQAMAGAANNIVGEEEEDLFLKVEVQLAFLARFADTIATGGLSDPQIKERSKLYAGEGRAVYFEQAGRANALYGWVEDYIAVDDRNTCIPCANAEAMGPYLPGEPGTPMPGRICLGRGYCRCVRLLRYDEAAYLRLV